MTQKEIRLLRADEIECRVGMVNEKGLSLLLYKDARADMKILDETFGSTGWQRIHELIGGNLYCRVQIWDEEKQQWISKMDVGTESYTEKEKGQASDSFKRACVSVGVGRELYTAPFLWVSAAHCTIQKKNDKYVSYDRFTVREISYNDHREITGIVIVNQDGAVVCQVKNKVAGKMKEASFSLSQSQLREMNKELERTGVALDAVLQRYQVASVEEMTKEVYASAMNSLKKTKDRVA